jgi:hypothetical protein
MMGMEQAFNGWGIVTHVSYESRPQMGADAVRVTLVTDGSDSTDDALTRQSDGYQETDQSDANQSGLTTAPTGDGVYEYPVTNADWHIENPWLALLAYCGAQPSTVEDDFVGSTVPLQISASESCGNNSAKTTARSDGVYSVEIPMTVFGNGQAILKQSEWGPVA